ncbi:MAG: hypothetical protein JSU70_11030, partial [Phycisphaerales bacterium]
YQRQPELGYRTDSECWIGPCLMHRSVLGLVILLARYTAILVTTQPPNGAWSIYPKAILTNDITYATLLVSTFEKCSNFNHDKGFEA